MALWTACIANNKIGESLNLFHNDNIAIAPAPSKSVPDPGDPAHPLTPQAQPPPPPQPDIAYPLQQPTPPPPVYSEQQR